MDSTVNFNFLGTDVSITGSKQDVKKMGQLVKKFHRLGKKELTREERKRLGDIGKICAPFIRQATKPSATGATSTKVTIKGKEYTISLRPPKERQKIGFHFTGGSFSVKGERKPVSALRKFRRFGMQSLTEEEKKHVEEIQRSCQSLIEEAGKITAEKVTPMTAEIIHPKLGLRATVKLLAPGTYKFEKSKGILGSLKKAWEAFINLFTKKKERKQELRTKFAIQVFEEKIDDTTPTPTFSETIHLWNKTIASLNDPSLNGKLPALQKLESYQREFEKISQISDTRARERARAALQKNMWADIQQAKWAIEEEAIKNAPPEKRDLVTASGKALKEAFKKEREEKEEAAKQADEKLKKAQIDLEKKLEGKGGGKELDDFIKLNQQFKQADHDAGINTDKSKEIELKEKYQSLKTQREAARKALIEKLGEEGQKLYETFRNIQITAEEAHDTLKQAQITEKKEEKDLREIARRRAIRDGNFNVNDAKKNNMAIYIPGGIWRQDSPTHLVYELTYDKDNYNWSARVVDISGKLLKATAQEQAQVEPRKEEKKEELSREKLHEGMEALVTPQNEAKEEATQVADVTFYDAELQECLKESSYTLTMGEVTEKPVKGFLSAVAHRKKEEIFGKDPYKAFRDDVAQKEKQGTKASPIKTKLGDKLAPPSKKSDAIAPAKQMAAFLRTIGDKEQLKIVQFEARIRSFISIWENAGDAIHDATFLGWIRENGGKLLDELQRLAAPSGGAQAEHSLASEKPHDKVIKMRAYLEKALQTIISDVNTYETSARFTAPQGPTREVQRTTFSTPIQPEATLIHPASVRKREVLSTTKTAPSAYATTPSKYSKEDLQTLAALLDKQGLSFDDPELQRFIVDMTNKEMQLAKDIGRLNKLVNQGAYQEASFVLDEVSRALSGLSDTEIRLIAFDKSDATSWIRHIQNIGFLVVKTALGQGRLSPYPKDIENYLTALRLQDQIIRARPDLKDDPYVKDFALDMSPLERVLAHPYLHLGESAAGIKKSLDYFRTIAKEKTLAFMGRDYNDRPGDSDKNKLIQKYAKTPEQEFDAVGFSGGAHVAKLRESYVLFDALLSPTRVFFPYSTPDFLRCTSIVGESGEASSINELYEAGERRFYEVGTQFVKDHTAARTSGAPVELGICCNHPVLHQDFLVVKPWNWAVRRSDSDMKSDYHLMQSKFDQDHSGTYALQGSPVDEGLKPAYEQVVLLDAAKGDPSPSSEGGAVGSPILTTIPADKKVVTYSHDGIPFTNAGVDLQHVSAKSEWTILQEEKPLPGFERSPSQELQLAQTGNRSVVQNSVSYLANNIAILDDVKLGPQVAQLMQRNILRYAVCGATNAEGEQVTDQSVLEGAFAGILDSYSVAMKDERFDAAVQLYSIAFAINAFLSSTYEGIDKEKPPYKEFATATSDILHLNPNREGLHNSRDLILVQLQIFARQIEPALIRKTAVEEVLSRALQGLNTWLDYLNTHTVSQDDIKVAFLELQKDIQATRSVINKYPALKEKEAIDFVKALDDIEKAVKEFQAAIAPPKENPPSPLDLQKAVAQLKAYKIAIETALKAPKADEELVESSIKTLFELVKHPPARQDAPVIQERIQWLRTALLPHVAAKMGDETKRKHFCRELATSAYPQATLDPNQDWTPVGSSGLVFRQGDITIDFSRGEVWRRGIREQLLPSSVTQHPQFSTVERLIRESLAPKEAIDPKKATWNAFAVSVKGNEQDRAMEYRLHCGTPPTVFRLLTLDDGSLILYRRKPGGKWFQFQPSISPKEPPKGQQAKIDFIPLPQGDYWIRGDKKELLIERHGIPEWEAQLSGGEELKVSSLQRLGKQEGVVANIAGDPHFRHFFDIDSTKNVAATSKQGRVCRIEYLNRSTPYAYSWDTTSKTWRYEGNTTYYLSEKTFDNFVTQPTGEELSSNPSIAGGLGRLKGLFHPAFSTYHLLESTQGKAMLVMPGVILKPKTVLEEKKLAHKFVPLWDQSKDAKVPQYTFTVDPVKGLVAQEQPEGYLYLAYSLLMQGNVQDAFAYLGKADLRLPLTEEGDKFLKLMQGVAEKLPTDTRGLTALKARILLVENHARESGKEKIEDFSHPKTALKAKKLYDELKKGGALQLSESEMDELHAGTCYTWFPFLSAITESDESWKLTNKVVKLLDKAKNGKEPLQAYKDLQKNSDWINFETTYLKPYAVSISDLAELSTIVDLEQMEKMTAMEVINKLIDASHAKTCSALNAEIQQLKEATALPEAPTPAQEATKPPSSKPLFEDTLFESYFLDEENLPFEMDEKQPPTPVSGTLTAEQSKLKSEEDQYQKEMLEGIRQDCDVHAKKVSQKRTGIVAESMLPEGMPPLSTKLKTTIEEHNSLVAKQRSKLFADLNRLRAAQEQKTPFEKLRQKFRGTGRTSDEELFDTAVRCAGENNWEPLRNLLHLSETTDIDKIFFNLLSENVREYLVLSIRRNQLLKAQDLLKSLPEDKTSEDFGRISREISDLLRGSWSYDPDNDPHALSYLLIEYELGFVCRESQIKVVQSYLQPNSVFKQEICGGGKTTVLRNIISKLQANGKILSGVSTLSPLRAEHGLMYARTTKNAYGGAVFELHFDRSTPTDELSLLRLHHDLLAIAFQRGRVDLSRGDLQTIVLATHLKYDEALKIREKLDPIQKQFDAFVTSLSAEQREKLEESLAKRSITEEEITTLHKTYKGLEKIDIKAFHSLKKQLARLHRETDILEDISEFLSDHASIVADEIDEDCDPTQEKNYAYGDTQALDEQQREGALEILETILTGTTLKLKKLASAIRDNAQKDLTEAEVKEALQEAAKILYEKYKDQKVGDKNFGELCAEKAFINYLTGDPNAGQTAKALFDPYQKSPEPLPSVLQKLAFTRQFMSECLEEACKKRWGDNYGRSHDGVTMIPCAEGKKKEGSEHSSNMERIWYTVVDYAFFGLTEDQARSLWLDAKEAAIREVAQARKLDPKSTLTIDKTKAATRFHEAILKATEGAPTLSKLTESDLPKICEAIKKKPAALISFLKHTVLSGLRQSKEKIVSDAQDPAYSVREFSGSSGTDMRAKSLPDKISSENARQPGVHGEIIASLQDMEDPEKRGSVEGRYLSYSTESAPKTEQQQALYELLAQEMQGGDCLSEVGRLFPGISSLDIAKNLRAHIKKKNEGHPEATIPSIAFMDEDDRWKVLSEEGVREFKNLKPTDVITIFDSVHTRGAERPSTAGVTEFVTIDLDTNFSRFEQAVMRERGVTKGKAKVRYILSPRLSNDPRLKEKIQKGDMNVDSLLDILMANEAKELKLLNYRAERQKIQHILRRFGERALRKLSSTCRNRRSPEHQRAREILFSQLRQLYIVQQKADALAAAYPRQSQSVITALDELVQSQLTLLDNIEKNLREAPETKPMRDTKLPVSTEEMVGRLQKITEDVDTVINKLKKTKENIHQVFIACALRNPEGSTEPDPALAFRVLDNDKKKELQEKVKKLEAAEKEIQNQIEELEKRKQLLKDATKELPALAKTAQEGGGDVFEAINDELKKASQYVTEAYKEADKNLALLQKIPSPLKELVFNDLTSTIGSLIEDDLPKLRRTIDDFSVTPSPLDLSIEVLDLARPLLLAKASRSTKDSYEKAYNKKVEEQRKKACQEIFAATKTIHDPTEKKLKVKEALAKSAEMIAKENGREERQRAEIAKYHESIVPRIDEKYLPKTVATGTELGKESENETEVQVEQEVSKEAAEDKFKGKDYPYVDVRLPAVMKESDPSAVLRGSLAPSTTAKSKNLHQLTELNPLHEKKFYTENFYPIQQSKGELQPWYLDEKNKLVCPQQRPIRRTLFLVNKHGVAEIFGSQQDIERTFHAKVQSVEEGYATPLMYNYDRECFDYTPKEFSLANLSPEIARKLIQSIATTKLLRGDTSFSGKREPLTGKETSDQILANPYRGLVDYIKTLNAGQTALLKTTMQALLKKQNKEFTDSDIETAFFQAEQEKKDPPPVSPQTLRPSPLPPPLFTNVH